MTPLAYLDELEFLLIEYSNALRSYEDSLEYLTAKKKNELEQGIENIKLRMLNCMNKIIIIHGSKV